MIARSIKQWLASFRLFIRISLFMASPADLPYNPVGVVLTLVAYYGVALYVLGGQYEQTRIAILIAVEAIILIAISYLTLTARKLRGRLVQTLSALFGGGLIISLIGIPVMMLAPGNAEGEVGSVARNLNLALILWSLAVISLIFKRAFEVSTLAAGFLAFNYLFFYELIIVYLLK